MKFTKPDEATIKRMTVQSITSLIGSLKQKRTTLVAPLDAQIDFYEKLLKRKEEEIHNRNQTRLIEGDPDA